MTSLLFDHLTDKLLILSTIVLTFYTAKAANETAREVRKDDARIIRLLVKRNRNAKHAKGETKAENDESNVRRLG